MGDMLKLIGYPSVVRKNDIKEITKLVLSKKVLLSVRKNSLALNGLAIFDVEQVRNANDQAVELYWFKQMNLPVSPQKTEKVYAKYFKK